MLRRIPLGKMNNLRDLGGYPAGDGVTVWERFLRGDNPAGLSEQDIQWLRERDITTIVDLRSGRNWRVSRTSSAASPVFYTTTVRWLELRSCPIWRPTSEGPILRPWTG